MRKALARFCFRHLADENLPPYEARLFDEIFLPENLYLFGIRDPSLLVKSSTLIENLKYRYTFTVRQAYEAYQVIREFEESIRREREAEEEARRLTEKRIEEEKKAKEQERVGGIRPLPVFKA